MNKQTGVALIACLLLLLAITLIAVSNMSRATMEVKMTGNLYDRQLAMQQAEAALLAAEQQLANAPLPGGALALINNNGIYDIPDSTAAERWAEGNTSTWLSGPVMNGGRVNTAEYIIEYLGYWPFPPECDRVTNPPLGCLQPTFRVTARVPADSGRAAIMLQTIWRG